MCILNGCLCRLFHSRVGRHCGKTVRQIKRIKNYFTRESATFEKYKFHGPVRTRTGRMQNEMNNRMQAKEDLGLIAVKALPHVCAPLIPNCLDGKTCGCSITMVHRSHTGSHQRARRTCERGKGCKRRRRSRVNSCYSSASKTITVFCSTWRQDRILFDAALHHTEAASVLAPFLSFIDALHCIAQRVPTLAGR